jgi:chromosomal replication initiator protein
VGKEHTQTQFFHTFNALYDAGKKIVISSDRPPKELVTLEERLRSRFEWGLIVDIQPPDLETRIAILKRKAEIYQFHVPDDVLVYIAERIDSNIRFLEGALVRLQAYMNLHKKKNLTPTLTRDIIGDLLAGDVEEEVSISTIQATVCEYFDIKLADLIGHARLKKYSMPRHIAQYLCRKLTSKSLPEIGVHFGGRNHTSVLHACRKIGNAQKNDHNLATLINHLTKNVKEKS